MDRTTARIAYILKSLRTKHNFSQEHVADVLGKSDYSGYQRLESGRTALGFDDAARLAELYKVPMEYIYDHEQYEEDHKKVEGWNEQREEYILTPKLQISVTLDGQESTLKKYIEMLTNVNNAMSVG